MKKIVMILTMALGVLTSCSKDEDVSEVSSLVNVNPKVIIDKTVVGDQTYQAIANATPVNVLALNDLQFSIAPNCIEYLNDDCTNENVGTWVPQRGFIFDKEENHTLYFIGSEQEMVYLSGTSYSYSYNINDYNRQYRIFYSGPVTGTSEELKNATVTMDPINSTIEIGRDNNTPLPDGYELRWDVSQMKNHLNFRTGEFENSSFNNEYNVDSKHYYGFFPDDESVAKLILYKGNEIIDSMYIIADGMVYGTEEGKRPYQLEPNLKYSMIVSVEGNRITNLKTTKYPFNYPDLYE